MGFEDLMANYAVWSIIVMVTISTALFICGVIVGFITGRKY